MFCIQCETAIKNLLDPPQIDSTLYRDITEVDLPLITVCPTDQNNFDALSNLGYLDQYGLMKGVFQDKTSWGGYYNLTFPQLLYQTFDPTVVSSILITNDENGRKLEADIVYIPRYGFCKEISVYDVRYEMSISTYSPMQIRVFVTDRNFRSFFSPDFTSHQGNPMIVEAGEVYYYDVAVDLSSSCLVDKDQVTKDDFVKGVDDEIQNEIGRTLGCIPPWMSSSNQCNGTYPFNFAENLIPDFTRKFIDTTFYLRKTEVENRCRKYCSSLTANIQVREKLHLKYSTGIHLTFNPRVKVTEKVFNYSPFQFIIDVGSSVGLWLGLSILGLYDLWAQAVHYFKANVSSKKLSSFFK